ncbi:MAG TPA: DUF3048 domain-containing protein [Anaerolineales bacterium]|nr:DUF3048 domain-containing protein [Anaerolineales bacterium]
MATSRILTGRGIVLLALSAALIGCTQPLGLLPGGQGVAPDEASSTASVAPASEPPTFTPSLAPELPESTPTATEVPTVTATPTPAPLGPAFAPGIDPLTGLAVDDPALLERRPMGIKVSNFPRSLRPHTGLSLADLVFEYYTEEGMTRFLAFYLGHDAPKVGPMRSVRLVDGQLVKMYNGILGFVGGDPFVLGRVIGMIGSSRAFSQSPSTCPAICREGNGNVNSVFADTAELTGLAKSQGAQDLNGMVFSNDLPPWGVPGTHLHVQFSYGARAEWRWNSDLGAYQRWSEDLMDGKIVMEPLTDRLTEQQIQSPNVVVAYAWYARGSGNEKYNIEFVYRKRGRAQVFRDGMMVEGFWLAADSTSPLQFIDSAGNPLPLKPGATWIEVVGENSTPTETAPGEWNVRFRFP